MSKGKDEPAKKPAGSSAEARSAPPVKIIKRYTNRKLYDTVESRYVTLEEIAEMIRVGEDVRIIDNRTKEDLTSVTLAQIIFEQEKKTGRMPLAVLRDIVRNGGGTLQDFFEREIQPRVASIREGAERIPKKVFGRRDLQDIPMPEPPTEPPTEQEARAYLKQLVEGFRQNVDQWQLRVQDWQRHVDDRLQNTLQSVTGLPALHKDLIGLRARLDDIEKKITALDDDEDDGDGETGAGG